jgi:hypothetical protein
MAAFSTGWVSEPESGGSSADGDGRGGRKSAAAGVVSRRRDVRVAAGVEGARTFRNWK